MDFTIEQCQKEDMEEVILVNMRSIPEHYELNYYMQCLDSFPEGFLVAKNTNKVIVGYIMCRAENTIIDVVSKAKVAHIVSVAVVSDYRKNGIGNKLVGKAIDAMLLANCNAVTLQVRQSNLPALNLYKKYGFKVIQALPGYYRDNNETGLLMYLELAPPSKGAT